MGNQIYFKIAGYVDLDMVHIFNCGKIFVDLDMLNIFAI